MRSIMFASPTWTLLSVIVLYSFLLPILPNCLCDHSSRIYRKISPFLLAWTETTGLSQLSAAHILPPSWFYEYRKVSWVTLCYEAWCTAWCELGMGETLVDFFVSFSEICRKLNIHWYQKSGKPSITLVMFQFHFLRLPEENVAGFSDCFRSMTNFDKW